jgi:DNA ligase-1
MNIPGFKPMLACDADKCGDTLSFPKLVSPKLDGIRAFSWGGVLYSRNLKPIRNEHVQRKFRDLPDGLDGELMVGAPNDPEAMVKAQSVIMSFEKPAGEVIFNAFDSFKNAALKFSDRLEEVYRLGNRFLFVDPVNHYLARTLGDVQSMEEDFLAAGYEGAMLRDPGGAYKHGRSTPREQGLLKLKRFKDGEAVVVGTAPQMHNANEQTRDELGRSKRSTARGGLVEQATLGKLHVRDIVTGQDFSIGTGLNDAQRVAFWRRRDELVGKIVKYKYFPTGTVSAPRFPVFIGFRDPADMGG